jgi:glutamine synthetase
MMLYGEDNDQRLTGIHETSSFKKFSFGVGNRAASFRIPTQVRHDNGKGYIEDRRPASNIDAYIVGAIIADTSILDKSMADPMVEHFRKYMEHLKNTIVEKA